MRTTWFMMALLLQGACGARTPAQTASAVPQESLSTQGPPEAQVRSDLDCPEGEIVYTGGLGTPTRVIVRGLTACGVHAVYERAPDGAWARKAE